MKECPDCGRCYEDEQAHCPDDGCPLAECLPGPRLIDGKYLLERCLGRGGMGAVYQAAHKGLQKKFALKLIESEGSVPPSYLARFQVEAKALGKLQHPNIVLVTDYGIDLRNNGLPYLVMEYLEGTTLLHCLHEKKFLAAEEAIPLLESIAGAIDYAHSRNILHRDLKLQNIFLVKDAQGRWQPKILDFGLARIAADIPVKEGNRFTSPQKKILSVHPQGQWETTQTLVREGNGVLLRTGNDGRERLTQAGAIMGTPGYIAPEILEGFEATKASDIYSFGIIIFRTLTGGLPFEDSGVKAGRGAVLKARSPSSVLPALPVEFDEPVIAPLGPDPKSRPEKAMDVIFHLKRALAECQYRRWKTQEVPKRIRLAGILTVVFVLLFLLAGRLAVFQNIEYFLEDMRFRLLPSRPPDERIVLVSIDEASLERDPALLTGKADDMCALLERVMVGNPKGIAVDFLLPERWNQSERLTKFILKNREKLILAAYATKDGTFLGMEILRGLIMAALGTAEQAEALFGLLNVRLDDDGRLRRAQLGTKTQDGKWFRSMPAKAFQMLTGRLLPEKKLGEILRIDYSIAADKYGRISWKDLASVLEKNPDFFKDKFVLIGGEYEGSQDFHRIPRRAGTASDEVSGLLIQALTINTLVENKPFREGGRALIILIMAATFMALSSISFIRPKASTLFLFLFAILVGYLIFALVVFLLKRWILPVGLPLCLWLLALAVILGMRRRLSFISKEVD